LERSRISDAPLRKGCALHRIRDTKTNFAAAHGFERDQRSRKVRAI
jgi:hypothetical protein